MTKACNMFALLPKVTNKTYNGMVQFSVLYINFNGNKTASNNYIFITRNFPCLTIQRNNSNLQLHTVARLDQAIFAFQSSHKQTVTSNLNIDFQVRGRQCSLHCYLLQIVVCYILEY